MHWQAGGGGDDVEIGSSMVSLRCPLSGSRIKIPARFASVGGLNAFDLDTFMDVVERTRKWQCPHSMRSLPVQELMVDGFLSCILSRLEVLIPPLALAALHQTKQTCCLCLEPVKRWCNPCPACPYNFLYAIHWQIYVSRCFGSWPTCFVVLHRSSVDGQPLRTYACSDVKPSSKCVLQEIASDNEVVCCLQKLPDVMEIEVSPSGEWRLPGSQGRWLSILDGSTEALEDVRIKADPDMLKEEAGAIQSGLGTFIFSWAASVCMHSHLAYICIPTVLIINSALSW